MEPLLPFDKQKHRPESNGVYLLASYMNVPPVIDGDLSEWQSLPCTTLDQTENISYGDQTRWTDRRI